MNQNTEQEHVLIARNNETGQVGAVTGVNADGTPQMADAKAAKLSDLIHFSKGQNPLEAFMSNFMRQCQNPSSFGFFKVPADQFETLGVPLADLVKDPEANAEMLKEYKVTPTVKHLALDPEKIDWARFEGEWGVSRAWLEKSGDLDKMLNFGKSGLVKIRPTLAGEKVEMEVRLSLRTGADGNIKLVPHPIFNKPNLEREYRGYTFTEADKEQLLSTGNLGKVVELNGKNGEKIPSYVSIDSLTNQVVSMSVNGLHINHNIGRTELTKEEIDTLKAGNPIVDKEITLRNGNTFRTTLQVSAEARGVEFVSKSRQNHKVDQAKGRSSWTDAEGNIRPIGKWKGVAFTEQQKQDYVDGKVVKVENAVNKEGQPCTLYVQFDTKLQRPLGHPEDPTLKQKQEQKPAKKEQRAKVSV